YIISGLGNQIALQNVFGTPISQSQLEAQIASALAIVNLTGSQVSSFPLGSSAGGFNWTFDPVLGVFSRASDSFGPVFAERAMTVGRRQLNVGMNYQRATFDSLQGKSLDGEVKTVVGFTRPGAAVLLEDSLTLKLSTDTVGLFATYGVTDRWDLGVAVPI